MSATDLASRRRRSSPATSRSHEEIYDLVARALEQAEQANQKAADAVSRADLAHLVGQRVEIKVDALIKAVGEEHEDERGQRVGTGVIGRLMRLEASVAKRFGLYDGWLKIGTGFAAAIALAWAVVWFLVKDRLGFLK